MSFDIVNRKKIVEALHVLDKQARSEATTQLKPHEIDAIIYRALGISRVYFRSTSHHNTARVEIADAKRYVMAKLKYGF